MQKSDYSENIIESMIDTVIIVNTDARIESVNNATVKLLGYDKSELIGKLIGAVIPEENFNFFSAIRDMIKNNSVHNYNLSYITKQGETIPIGFCGSALRDQEENLIGIVGVGRDIRENQRLINELEKAKTSLEAKVLKRTSALEGAYNKLKLAQSQLVQSEKLSSIGQLAAGVAHEINNPIGFINSNLGTLNEYTADITNLIKKIDNGLQNLGKNSNPNISSFYNEINEQKKEIDYDFIIGDISKLIIESKDGAERVKRIVQDLKDFSRIDKSELKMADLNQELEKTLNIIRNELKYKTTLIKEYGDLPEIRCYPRHLDQAFMNLLINAVQAIDKQGKIKIATFTSDENIVIEISDTGSGIPEENIPKLFDPFFTTKEVGKGTGLGLNITYNTIKNHGGRIEVKSKIGVGTTFRLFLPVKGIK